MVSLNGEVLMLKQQILQDLKKAIAELGFKTTDIVLSISKNPSFGDYSTNIALQLAKQKSTDGKQNPEGIANQILSNLSNLSYLEKVEVAGGGFINFFVKKEKLPEDLKEILEKGEEYGRSAKHKGKKARVEFVSANPTGPLHFGNGRGGPLGDCLSSVLEFVGYKVLREYINNDKGNQVKELGKTLAARAGLLKISEDELAYKGEYTRDLALKVKEGIGDTGGLSEDEITSMVGEMGVKLLHEENLEDAKKMGITFDLVVSDSDLQKQAPKLLEELEQRGSLKRREGAVWFAPKDEFLGDREAVVIKSDGDYTYFVADIAYHKEKFTSGYDLVVDIFGSNTAGHVPKLQALAVIFGFDPEKFKVILYQYVRIKRGNEVVKMSKRAGNFITVREVLDEVGKDALRFMLLMYAPQTHMDFDLELAKQQSNKNPVFYVQYAHARMAGILEKMENGKLKVEDGKAEYKLLIAKVELDLIKHLFEFPGLVEDIAKNFQVHQLTSYVITLADLFHKFYEVSSVLNAESEELKQARLKLVQASQITLKNTLNLLGVSSPEKM